MKTQLVVQQVKLKHWAEIIQGCQSSGLKVSEWCKQNNITKDAYYYWLKKVRAAVCETMESNFVQVPHDYTVPDMAAGYDFKTELTITIGTATIQVSSTTPPHLIHAAVKAVSNA